MFRPRWPTAITDVQLAGTRLSLRARAARDQDDTTRKAQG